MNKRMNTKEWYDSIGVRYDSTCKADPYLAQRMFNLLKSEVRDAMYLDVGCGTGNYTAALHKMGMNMAGLEPSDEMLIKARLKPGEIT